MMLSTQPHHNSINGNVLAPQLYQSRHSSAATSNHIRTATIADQESIIAAIVLAFSSDPAARWMYPDPHQYLTYFPQFVKAFGGKSFAQETAYCINDCAGGALWFPPGVEPDIEPVVDLLQNSILESDQPEVFAVFEQMEQYHPKESHWYLPLIGVEPAHQGKGYGSALMQHVLMQCDRDRIPAYLEASKPESVPFYQQHGFEVLGIIQIETFPQIIPMFRHSR